MCMCRGMRVGCREYVEGHVCRIKIKGVAGAKF